MVRKDRVTIRRAARADRAKLLAFHHALYVTHRDRVVPEERVPLVAYRDFEKVLREDVDAMLANPEFALLVAEADGELVGYVSGHVEEDPRRSLPKRGVVGDWFVSPSTRAKGVGRKLVEALEAVFREAGCTAMESATWPTNEGARRAHEALGFLEVQIVYRKRI